MSLEQHFERKENYGHDVTIMVDIIRHAEKAGANGPLTQEGIEAARSLGKKLRSESPDSAGIKVYHSGVKRAEQTGEAIAENTPFIPRKKPGLNLHGKFSDEFLEEFESRVNDGGNESQAVQWYLDFGDQKPDATTASSKEASEEIVREINHIIEMSKRLKEHSKVNIVLVSHSGVVEHFIADALKIDRKNFTSETGGSLGYLEDLKIIVHRISPTEVKIQMKFRDKEVELTEDDLEKI